MARRTLVYHPTIGHLYLPNMRARIRHEGGGYLIRTDEFGFRNTPKLPSGELEPRKKVLVFGDSFTAGDGVSNAHRYTDLLDARYPHLRVTNFGLPGSGTDQQYLCYEEFGRKRGADLIVLAPLVENIRRVAAHARLWTSGRGSTTSGGQFYAKPYFELSGGELHLKNVPVPRKPLSREECGHVEQGGRHPLLRKVIARAGLRSVVQRFLRVQPLPEYSGMSAEWQLMKKIFEKWAESIARAHPEAEVILLPIPLYHYIEGLADPTPYQEKFRVLAQQLRWHFCDPLPIFTGFSHRERRAFRFKNDVHLSKEGHAVLSQVLERFLLEKLEFLGEESLLRAGAA
ncbi:SGNH/GDSL hydrolase family protein [bacterium]|nr:SGNH/GDSL hydrolase family protein [bacterium]